MENQGSTRPVDEGGVDESFTLLDVGNSTDGSSGGSKLPSDGEQPLPKWPVYAFNVLNTVVSCAAVATAKQMFNPSNFQPITKEVQNLPSWYASRFRASPGQAVIRRVLYDMGILMVASGTYQGISWGLKSIRGADDAANITVAGAISAAFLGATFVETTSLRRVGVWGAAGAAVCYYGYTENQAVRHRLLERQQEMEQRLMGVEQEAVHAQLDPLLFRKLLQLEEQQRLDHLKGDLEHTGALPNTPSGTSAGAEGVDALQALSSGSGGAAGGSRGSSKQEKDAGDAWSSIMQSAPWLPKAASSSGAGGSTGGSNSSND